MVVAMFAAVLLFASAGLVGAQEERRDASQTCTAILDIIDNDQILDQYIVFANSANATLVQYISQEFNISPTLIQECIQEVRGTDDGGGNGSDTNGTDTVANTGTDTLDTADVAASDIVGEDIELHHGEEVLSDSIPKGFLPDTGGLSAPDFGGALLLLCGVLLARKVVRR